MYMRIIEKWSFKVQHDFGFSGLEDILARKYILLKDEKEKICEFSESELREFKKFFTNYQEPPQLQASPVIPTHK